MRAKTRQLLAPALIGLLMTATVLVGRVLPEDAPSADAGDTAAKADAPDNGYVVHEWGTFTSVSGSDGELLPGLEREEEVLPGFVYAHDGMAAQGIKGMRRQRQLENVTIKMETPVLYFYSDRARRVSVDVGFRGGAISQWYPNRTSGEVLPALNPTGLDASDGAIDFADGYDGHIGWDVDVLPPDHPDAWRVHKGSETRTWVLPRQVDANTVRNGAGEHERFLFYRGLGNFELPLRFTVTGDTLGIENRGAHPVPAMLVFDHMGTDQQYPRGAAPASSIERQRSVSVRSRARFAMLGPLGSGDAASVTLHELEARERWQSPVYAALRGSLIEAGLYPKEADAMIQTWWQSYFEHEGLRVFWIVPRAMTDRILPLSIDPAPEETVRVLVGRSEVLTPAFERELTSLRRASSRKLEREYGADRYFEAYEARVEMLRGATE